MAVDQQRRVRVFVDGMLGTPRLDHPEGIAVHPADGSVWCGGERGQVYRIAPDGSAIEQVADTGGFMLGVAFGPDGGLYACDLARPAVVRVDPDDGTWDVFATGPIAPNHLCFDGDGHLYVSDCRGQGDVGPGVFRFERDGSGGVWCEEDFDFANGLALAADGGALYVAESWARRVRRVPIGADGGAGASEVAVELPGTVPDGLAVAADGALYVALYQPSRIVRVEGDGSVSVVADDPDAHLLCHPTNIVFRGTDMLAANLGRWHVTLIEAGVAGTPLPPRGPV